ncbi:hypothetical protein LEM8419_00098 [Neolewinella maritima]|uniref:TlpA family protein disulfide reductase n=1 Tax=Neolewinella maritima TaxID=1383882 RepID=A0ABN8F269_9BACT|nr:hypothetical protein [Neolewinella maritima]CAH0998750.1 hypothetical protein LEM8419_00098 [Neolewinella maritima]
MPTLYPRDNRIKPFAETGMTRKNWTRVILLRTVEHDGHQIGINWHLWSKMVRVLLAALSLILLFGSCSADPNTEQVPWQSASFVDPIPTTITFVNAGSSAREISGRVQDYHLDLGVILPDSLQPGDSIRVALDLYRPRYVFYQSEYNVNLRMVLPGLDRVLVHTDSEMVEVGHYALEYAYIDRVILPLNLIGRQPPTETNLVKLQQAHFQNAKAHFDTVTIPEGLPSYIPSLLLRTLELASFFESTMSHNYHLFFLEDTVPVPAIMLDSIESLLAQEAYYQSPTYTDVMINWAQIVAEENYDTSYGSSTNLMTARANAYIKFPITSRRADAIADHLAGLIVDQRVYLNKEENILKLKQHLPPAHLVTITDLERSTIARSTSIEGLQQFLESKWEIPNGSQQTIGKKGEMKFRLLKFWFAGCMPCLKEQPHEQKFLTEHPEVELIYVAHSTRPDTWKSYLEEHRPPTQRQYLIPHAGLKDVVAAAGTTGAPTYVLVDSDGSPVCQPCPKPSDPLLSDFVSQN